MHKTDTSPSLNGIQHIIQEFFKDYPYMQHLNLSVDIFKICYLDKAAGLSEIRRYSLLDYLQATNAVFQQAHALLEAPSAEYIDQRKKAEKYGDKLILSEVDEAAMIELDPGMLLFKHTGLFNALDLLNDLTTATENYATYPEPHQKELQRFTGLLRQILIAVYVQYKDSIQK